MIGVDKVEDIRRRARRGESVSGIAAATGVSGPTVRKYIAAGDLSPRPPATRGRTSSPMMEPYAETVEGWLREDLRVWRKQRHTARRIHDRLVEEEGFQGSYETVRNFVRAARGRIARERGEREAQGYLVLDWRPGECQVDFGQADFRVRGTLRRGHYLVVEFPHSNVGLAQVFWGETAECVCHGLRAAFEFAGGVPSRAVFDNATEVGRRVGSKVVTSALFRAFAAHYGLDYSFTNPYSGNEKGSVENKVGALRRNLFVPVPSFHDVEAFNRRLLERCAAASEGKPHYRKGAAESGLFEEDRAAMSPLPGAPFSCVAWVTRKCDAQGCFKAGGDHRYSAGPALAGAEVAVAMGAFEVTVVGPGGEVAATYERMWGDAPTCSTDPLAQLELLCLRSGGWRDSVVRSALPGELVAYLDSEDPADLRADLRALRDSAARVGWRAAVEGASRALEATGGVDAASLELSAAVAASGGARTEYDEPVDLSGYDRALGLAEGGRRRCLGSPRPTAWSSPRGRAPCSYPGRPWSGSWSPRRPASSRRARRCWRASSSRASAPRGRACSGRRGSRSTRPWRGSTGPTSGSRTDGAATRCSPSGSRRLLCLVKSDFRF